MKYFKKENLIPTKIFRNISLRENYEPETQRQRKRLKTDVVPPPTRDTPEMLAKRQRTADPGALRKTVRTLQQQGKKNNSSLKAKSNCLKTIEAKN